MFQNYFPEVRTESPDSLSSSADDAYYGLKNQIAAIYQTHFVLTLSSRSGIRSYASRSKLSKLLVRTKLYPLSVSEKVILDY